MKKIEFRYRGENKLIVGAKNINTKAKLSKTPSQILYYLSISLNKTIKKSDLCKFIWGSDDFFIRRTMDVHVCNIKKFLRDSYYNLETKTNTIKLGENVFIED